MSEETNIHQEIMNKTVGFSFRLVVEVERRIDSGTKYPDKVVQKAELGGHADSFEQACANLTEAQKQIAEILNPKAEDEPKAEEPVVVEDENPSE